MHVRSIITQVFNIDKYIALRLYAKSFLLKMRL